MKRTKVTVNFKVPSWNFCNYDVGNGISSMVCRFCEKQKAGYRCMLYDEPLKFDGTLLEKTYTCCKNTAGFGIEIEDEPPAADPKELMKLAINLYSKTLKDLINQGYPQEIADTVAKQYILNGR